MAVVNWVFLKKSIFTVLTTGLASTPVILINKWGSFGTGGYISDFKKNLNVVSNKYASAFGLEDFAIKILQMHETKPMVEEAFASDIALNIVKNNPFFEKEFKELQIKETEDHDKLLSDFKQTENNLQKFYDFKGGNRADMERKELGDRSLNTFKTEILRFKSENFSISPNSKYLPSNYSLTKSAIENSINNNSDIKFFPIFNDSYKEHSSFFDEKFKFINYAYKQWFQESKPFYVHMSLWKYKKNATTSELGKVWKLDKLKEKKVDLKESSYAFPYFEDKDVEGLSSVSKFKKFFADKVKGFTKGQSIFVPKGYTDDSFTSIFVESSKMYDDLYARFAAAANYKYYKDIKKSSQQKWLNVRDKNWIDSFSNGQPSKLFMYQKQQEKTGTDEIIARIKVWYEMWNQTGQVHHIVSDATEIKDNPWMFIRNEAGIHAIASDSYEKTNFFNHFNYRTLQLFNKNRLRLDSALDLDENTPLRKFTEYLREHFNRLLVKYILSSESSEWKNEVDPSIIAFKESYEHLEKFFFQKKTYMEKMKLRETLLRTYVRSDWQHETKENKKTFNGPAEKLGMAGFLPYPISYEESEGDQEPKVFKDLEGLFEHNFFNNQDSKTTQENQNSIENYVKNLKIDFHPSINFLESDRVFTNNYILNRIIDKFLDTSEVFNELLFIYNLKTDYLGKSLLGKKLIKENFINLPTDYSATTSSSDDWFDSFSDTETEKIKKIFGKFDDLMMALYYAYFFLENEDTNPWMIIKYSGKLAKDYNSDTEFATELKKIAITSFQERFKYNIDGIRNKHFAFLNTLSYFMENNFDNFRKWIASNIDYHNDSYLLFAKPEDKKLQIPNKSFKNPFFDYKLAYYDDGEIQREVDNIHNFLRGKMFKDSQNKVSEKFNFLGLFVNTESVNQFSSLVPQSDRKHFHPKKLYRFGSSASEMDTYIKSISTDEEFKRIVTYLKAAISSSDWIPALELDVVYLSQDQSKELRYLTLQEKKNLLSAALNSKKIEITDGTIEKSKYKEVFLTDPESSFSPTNQPHQQASGENKEEKISKASHFSTDTTCSASYKCFQINPLDVSNFEKFKSYLNKNLSVDLFWSWIIHTSLKTDVQSLALADMSNRIEKVRVYDIKWHKSADKKFAS